MRKRAVDVTKGLSPALMEQLFSVMAGYFSVLSESSRLRIIYTICGGEKSVSEVLESVSYTHLTLPTNREV